MSKRRKIGADYSNTGLFDDPPMLTKDIPKFLTDVQDYVLNIIGEYGAWKSMPLEWLELENNIFGDAEEPDFTVPANVLIAQKILSHIQWANKYYNDGKTDKACFYIGTIVELLHAPINEKRSNLQRKVARKIQIEIEKEKIKEREKAVCKYVKKLKKSRPGLLDRELSGVVAIHFKKNEGWPKTTDTYRKILQKNKII